MRRRAIIATAALLALGASAALGASQSTDQQRFAQVEHGRYLAQLGDCSACHTWRPETGAFAGGRPIETPFGILVAPNITPDRDTGIGAWTDAEFDAAVRHGRRRDGAHLYPAMPYPAFAKMTREDVSAIRAYLNTIPSVHHDVNANQLPFPFRVRGTMAFWNALYFDDSEYKNDPNHTPEWNRGAFLVEGPGHCGACHTPKSFLGGDKASKALQGYAIQGWFAPNITNDAQRGLGAWSAEDIATYLRNGHNAIAAATGPMADEVAHSSSHMTDADLKAIAAYLKSLPGQDDKTTPVAASDRAMVAGAAIYGDVCSACHASRGEGVANLFPALAKSASVRSSDATTVVRVILNGARSVATAAEPTSPGMPSFGWQLNDDEVAAVATYIRNSWGNAAPSVTAGDVRNQRAALAARVD